MEEFGVCAFPFFQRPLGEYATDEAYGDHDEDEREDVSFLSSTVF